MSDVKQLARQNLKQRLADNPYPGRGVVLGLDETGERLVQVYWIMGRSENSRNRIFAHDDTRVWTEAADPAKCKDPSLIIYNALDELNGVYVVTNGNQTDTICQSIVHGGTFEGALATRDYEPDAPNFTPRISGMFDLRSGLAVGKMSVLRHSAVGDATDRACWTFESWGEGLGFCITTYMGDGKPLPPFVGDPYLLPLAGDTAAIAQSVWDNLDADNRVSLCAKTIDPKSLTSEVAVINKYEKAG